MSDLTSGDPLGGGPDPARRPPAEAPPRSSPGYTTAPPPGALGPAPPAATTPSWQQPRQASEVAQNMVLAGWWRRAGAQVVDGVIISLIALVVLVPAGIGAFSADSEGGFVAAALGILVSVLVFAAVALVYAPLLMVKTNGKTVGRMATGIRVVRTNGQAMDFSTAALREVVFKAILINGIAGSFTFGLASLVDYLWPLWDEENRALHDFPVNTRTVMG